MTASLHRNLGTFMVNISGTNDHVNILGAIVRSECLNFHIKLSLNKGIKTFETLHLYVSEDRPKSSENDGNQ